MEQFVRNIRVVEPIIESSMFDPHSSPSRSPPRSPTRPHARSPARFKRSLSQSGVPLIPQSTPLKQPRLPELDSGLTSFFNDLGDDTGEVVVYEDSEKSEEIARAQRAPYAAELSTLMEESIESPGQREAHRGRSISRVPARGRGLSSAPPLNEARAEPGQPGAGESRDQGVPVQEHTLERQHTQEHTLEPRQPTQEHTRELSRQASREVIRRAPTTPINKSRPPRSFNSPFFPATPGRILIPSSPQRDESFSVLQSHDIDTVDKLMSQLGMSHLEVQPLFTVLPGEIRLDGLNPVEHARTEIVQEEFSELYGEGVSIEEDIKAFIDTADPKAISRRYLNGDRAFRIDQRNHVRTFFEYLLMGNEVRTVEREIAMEQRVCEKVAKINAEYKARHDEFAAIKNQCTAVYNEIEQLKRVKEQSQQLDEEIQRLEAQVAQSEQACRKKEAFLQEIVDQNTLAARERKPAAKPQEVVSGSGRHRFLADLEALRLEMGVDDLQLLHNGKVAVVGDLRITDVKGLVLQFDHLGTETPLSRYYLSHLVQSKVRFKAAVKIWRRRLEVGLATSEFMRRGGCAWRETSGRAGTVLELEKSGEVVLTLRGHFVEVSPTCHELAGLAQA